MRFDSGHLFAPRRLTLRDQREQRPRSCLRPDFVGFLRSVTDVTLCVVSAIVVKSAVPGLCPLLNRLTRR
ncbi:hypothetical protein B1F75_12300 [Pseudomonas syringae]|nr:hypothetical protein B1F75_12300 [Pseudomonas syringae]